jgi:hypothetical protein
MVLLNWSTGVVLNAVEIDFADVEESLGHHAFGCMLLESFLGRVDSSG